MSRSALLTIASTPRNASYSTQGCDQRQLGLRRPFDQVAHGFLKPFAVDFAPLQRPVPLERQLLLQLLEVGSGRLPSDGLHPGLYALPRLRDGRIERRFKLSSSRQ